jgi:hypothetical protein
MRRVAISLLAASLLLALAACGGGGTKAVTPELYTGSVCAALSAWEQQLESASAILAQRTSTSTSLKDVRKQFVAFFGGAIDETDVMLTAVEEAGVPDVTDGPQVSAALLESLRKFRPILIAAQAKARRLPIGDEQLFTTQAQRLGAAFLTERGKLRSLWETLGAQYGAPELARAADANTNCGSL